MYNSTGLILPGDDLSGALYTHANSNEIIFLNVNYSTLTLITFIMDMDGKVGTIVSSLKDEEGAVYSISSHEETTEENYSVTNQDLEDSQSEDSSQGDLDDYYDKEY